MSTNTLPQNSTASTKAIVYQLCVAVQKCYEMTAGQKVRLEKEGDVTIPGDQQIETKQYSDKLTDNHPNLWKTLFNWMRDEFDESQYLALILCTTQTFGKNALIVGWNTAPPERRLEILHEIYKKTEKRGVDRPKQNPSSVLSYQKLVLDPSKKTKLEKITKKFIIEACSPSLPKMYAQIQQQYMKGILEGKRIDFLNALIGFITKADQPNEKDWLITYSEFEEKVANLTSQFCRETRLFPRKHFEKEKSLDQKQLEEHQDHSFVKKIKDIEYDLVISDAIKDYLGAVNTISLEFENYRVPPSRTRSYSDELAKTFGSRYRMACRKCTNLISDSQNFYDEINSAEPRDFEGFDITPLEFRNGMVHVLLDDEEKQLHWKLKK